jgi:hypothetical protein
VSSGHGVADSYQGVDSYSAGQPSGGGHEHGSYPY